MNSTIAWGSVQQLLKKEAGLGDECGTLYSKVNTVPTGGGQMDSLWRKVGLRDQYRTLVNTVPSLGGQIKRSKTCKERWGLEISTELLSTQCHHSVVRSKDQKQMKKGGALRSARNPCQHSAIIWWSDGQLVKVGLRDQHRTFVNTVPSLGGQIKSLWERWGLEISVVPSISPVNTVPSHGGQINILWGKRQGLEINV